MTTLKASARRRKIYHSVQKLALSLENKRDKGAKVVMCHGVFDVLHPGHIAHLCEATTYGDILVIGVTDDEFVNKGIDRPIFPLEQRLEQLVALEDVDYVFPVLSDSCTYALFVLRPDVYARGSDKASNRNDPLTLAEVNACLKAGVQRRFTKTKKDSSSRVIAKAAMKYHEIPQRWLEEFKTRFSTDQVLSSLDEISDKRVLVVGHNERCVFKYVVPYPQTPESYSSATRIVREIEFQGAGAAVCRHVYGFVSQAEMLSQQVAVTEEAFLDANSNHFLFMAQQRPSSFWLKGEQAEFRKKLKASIREFDVVIVVDYGLGLMTPEIQKIVEGESNFLAATVKAYHANFGFNDASKYDRVDYLCLNELEYKLALHHCPDYFASKKVMITRGKEGCNYLGHHTPSLATHVIDSVGCGDAILALTAPLVAVDIQPEIVGFFGQVIAAAQCAILSNTEPVKQKALRDFTRRLLGS